MVTGYLGCFSSVTTTTSSVAATTSRECAVQCSGCVHVLGGGRCRCLQTYADSADAAPAGGADGSCGADLCEGEEGPAGPRWCGSCSGDAEQAVYALMLLTCGAFDTVPAGSDESALARRGFAHALHENIALQKPARRRQFPREAPGLVDAVGVTATLAAGNAARDCSTEPAFEIDLEGTALVRSVEVVKLKSDVDRSLVGATVELVNVHGVVLRSFVLDDFLPEYVLSTGTPVPGVTTVRLKGARRVDEDGRLLTGVCLTAAELRVRGCVDRYLVEDQRGCKCPGRLPVRDRPADGGVGERVLGAVLGARRLLPSSYVEGSPSYCNLYKGASSSARRRRRARAARSARRGSPTAATRRARSSDGRRRRGRWPPRRGEAAVCAMTPTRRLPARADLRGGARRVRGRRRPAVLAARAAGRGADGHRRGLVRSAARRRRPLRGARRPRAARRRRSGRQRRRRLQVRGRDGRRAARDALLRRRRPAGSVTLELRRQSDTSFVQTLARHTANDGAYELPQTLVATLVATPGSTTSSRSSRSAAPATPTRRSPSSSATTCFESPTPPTPQPPPPLPKMPPPSPPPYPPGKAPLRRCRARHRVPGPPSPPPPPPAPVVDETLDFELGFTGTVAGGGAGARPVRPRAALRPWRSFLRHRGSSGTIAPPGRIRPGSPPTSPTGRVAQTARRRRPAVHGAAAHARRGEAQRRGGRGGADGPADARVGDEPVRELLVVGDAEGRDGGTGARRGAPASVTRARRHAARHGLPLRVERPRCDPKSIQ